MSKFDLDNQLKGDYSPTGVKFLRLADVLCAIGLKKTSLYKLVGRGDFPQPIRIGTSSLWTDEDVREWQLKMVRKRDLESLI